MTHGLWLSAAGMQTNQYRLNVLANNMANVDTVGFKRDLAVMQARRVEAREPEGARYRLDPFDNMSGGTFVRPTYHSFEEGPLTSTNNPLDTAIEGEGFFQVSMDGETRYTRDGRFTVNRRNELVMVANEGRARVLDEFGQPIRLLPATEGTPEVLSDGTIRQGEKVAGRIGVVEFADRNTLRKVGGDLFAATDAAPEQASHSTVLTKTVEGSTVDSVQSLAEMIEVTRAFQLNANLISLQDTTIGQAVSRVGRIA